MRSARRSHRQAARGVGFGRRPFCIMVSPSVGLGGSNASADLSGLIGLRSRFFPRHRTKQGWLERVGSYDAHDTSSLVISVKKHKRNDDADDDDNGLGQCTIQKPGSGMGCVAPLKLKCEKMKNGQKCGGSGRLVELLNPNRGAERDDHMLLQLAVINQLPRARA